MDVLYLALLWSPSALCLKIASKQLPPFTLLSICMGISSIVMLAACYYTKASLPKITPKLLINGFLLGTLCNGLPFTLQTLASPHIDSICLGLINSIIPIVTFIGCYLLFPDSKISLKNLFGLALGIIGTALLLFSGNEFSSSFPTHTLGVVLAVLSSSFYGFGLIYANSLNLNNNIIFPTMHISSTLIYLLPLAYFLESGIQMPELLPQTIASIVVLALPATSLAFIYYYKILENSNAVTLSTVNYILPIFKVILGVLILGEAINLNFAMSSVLIIIGVFLIT